MPGRDTPRELPSATARGGVHTHPSSLPHSSVGDPQPPCAQHCCPEAFPVGWTPPGPRVTGDTARSCCPPLLSCLPYPPRYLCFLMSLPNKRPQLELMPCGLFLGKPKLGPSPVVPRPSQLALWLCTRLTQPRRGGHSSAHAPSGVGSGPWRVVVLPGMGSCTCHEATLRSAGLSGTAHPRQHPGPRGPCRQGYLRV